MRKCTLVRFPLSLVCATPRMHGVLAPPLALATASPRAPHYSAHAQLIFVAIRNGVSPWRDRIATQRF